MTDTKTMQAVDDAKQPEQTMLAADAEAIRQISLISLAAAAVMWFKTWWDITLFGALAAVVALSPSTYGRQNREQIARNIYSSTWQVMPWFTILSALISLVLIRIVVVTAQSYGLSQFALEMVVRVLVLELIPLSAALFVIWRLNILSQSEWSGERPLGHSNVLHDANIAVTLIAHVPRMIASGFAVTALAAVSSAVALCLAYFIVYGLSPWGFGAYTRMVGHVFDPVVSLVFILKTLFFSLSVAIIPAASGLLIPAKTRTQMALMNSGTVRLFLVLLLIEAVSLAVKSF
ncbi:MAG: ABC transporter permease [Pseudomonadota bacterium]